MKKKLFVVALAAAMMLTFIGCGDTKAPSTENPGTEASTEANNTEVETETEEKEEIVFTDCDENLTITCGVSLYSDAEATKFAGRLDEGTQVHVTGKADFVYRAEVDGEIVFIKKGVNVFGE